MDHDIWLAQDNRYPPMFYTWNTEARETLSVAIGRSSILVYSSLRTGAASSLCHEMNVFEQLLQDMLEASR